MQSKSNKDNDENDDINDKHKKASTISKNANQHAHQMQRNNDGQTHKSNQTTHET